MALTAFGDPLYCEAIVTMHSYDIVLDIFIVNRTAGVPAQPPNVLIPSLMLYRRHPG
jgi:hypothetical protein